ncbi:siderophore-interacting protein [Streptomyces sp. NBC_01716]|uniref:siderophore-interacting protein n=1 Tax=Streptomyces sp. NBC_01716 TaxID=2975917 RepID=UPI002E303C95|nr:siderophore-interacting protein [Streptomyces sp. NBC_01716]
MGHGWEGVVLKVMGGVDFTFTVIGCEDVTGAYRRVRFGDGGMLAGTGTYPTMWVRLWFDNGGKPHQRAYTLVDPDPAAGTFAVEFALHDGPASDWARAARPGDTVEATLRGREYRLPEPPPARMFLVGDRASVPALNSLLDTAGAASATIWLETAHPDDDRLPLRIRPDRHEVRRVPRQGGGAPGLVGAVKDALPGLVGEDRAGAYVWIACDTVTTRALASYARRELRLPKHRVHATGYWSP